MHVLKYILTNLIENTQNEIRLRLSLAQSRNLKNRCIWAEHEYMNSNDKRSRFLTRNNLFDELSTTRLWSSTGLVVESSSNKLFLVRERLLLSLLRHYLTTLRQEYIIDYSLASKTKTETSPDFRLRKLHDRQFSD